MKNTEGLEFFKNFDKIIIDFDPDQILNINETVTNSICQEVIGDKNWIDRVPKYKYGSLRLLQRRVYHMLYRHKILVSQKIGKKHKLIMDQNP